MRSEDEIREHIKIAEERAKMYYEEGDFMQHNAWLDFADGMKWVLQEDNQ